MNRRLKREMMPVDTKPEFQTLEEGTVLAALDDNPDSQNPIAVEVGRLVAGYAADLRKKPALMPSIETHFPIEAVALRLASKLAGVPVIKEGQ